jgi:hypothetical protein
MVGRQQRLINGSGGYHNAAKGLLEVARCWRATDSALSDYFAESYSLS